jgi:hypothetical protein
MCFLGTRGWGFEEEDLDKSQLPRFLKIDTIYCFWYWDWHNCHTPYIG